MAGKESHDEKMNWCLLAKMLAGEINEKERETLNQLLSADPAFDKAADHLQDWWRLPITRQINDAEIKSAFERHWAKVCPPFSPGET